MEKTLITRAIFYLALQLIKVLVKRTDNKIDDAVVDTIDKTFNS